MFEKALEIIANASQPIIALVALLALRQLTIAKRDISVRSKRESRLLSMNLAEKFAKELIPAMMKINDNMKKEGFEALPIKFDNFWKEEVEKLSNHDKHIYFQTMRFYKYHTDFLLPVTMLSNQMEAVAMNFLHGVADEECAFSALSEPFCFFVEKNYIFYTLLRSQHKFNPHEDTIALYKIWEKRRKIRGLTLEKDTLENLMKSLKDEKLEPIGTD